MPGPLLQLVAALPPQPDCDSTAAYALGVARSFSASGAATLTLTPHPHPQEEPAWAGLRVFAPQPGEGALAAWHRTLDAVAPAAVWVHALGSVHPGLLLDLRERGIPYAVFLDDYAPLCPTRHLWHRRQERCSGPGRTGWKCAWCTGAPGATGWAGLPLRWLALRQRPQAWRTALLRAEVLIAPSRFAREFWIAQGAPPERIAVIAPITVPAPAALPEPAAGTASALVRRAHPPASLPTLLFDGAWDEASGSELLGAALDTIRRPLRLLLPGLATVPDAVRAAIAPRHQVIAASADGDTAGAVVVVPVRWEIPFSAQVFAAQAAGQRVVATAIGGVAEQILHGVNGYLSAPDDPIALAESLLEALEAMEAMEAMEAHHAFDAATLPDDAGAEAWGDTLVARQARVEAESATAARRRLLTLLAAGETEIAIQLEHRAWLDSLHNQRSDEDNTEALITALRLAGVDALPAAADLDFARRATSMARQARLDWNHAIAFFRACGCRRIAALPAPPAPEERAYAEAWGLEWVAPDQLPSGVFEDRRDGEALESGWLRRRFPQARGWAALGPAGLETAVWD